MESFTTLTPFLIVLAFFGSILWLLRPDLLALLVWATLLLYPKNLLFGALPLNAGLNDILIVALAARMLLYSNPGRPTFFRQGWPVMMLLGGMVVTQILSDLTGAIRYGRNELWISAAKSVLKGVVFASFGLIMIKSIVTPRDVRRHLAAFLVTISIAFILVWVCSWSTLGKRIWEVTTVEQLMHGFEFVQQTRSWGPFDSTNGLGVVIAAIIPFGVGLAAASGAGPIRILGMITVVSAAIAEFVTKARSPLTGIAIVTAGWILFSKWRRHVIAVLIIVGIAAALLVMNTGKDQELAERFSAEHLAPDSQVRFGIWKMVVTNPTAFILLFGEGMDATFWRLGTGPHNGFLDIVFLWGVGGLAMFIVFYTRAIAWARRVFRIDQDPVGRGVAWGLVWSVISIAGTAMTIDPWYVIDYRFFMYFLLAILWQRMESTRLDNLYAEQQVVQSDERMQLAHLGETVG